MNASYGFLQDRVQGAASGFKVCQKRKEMKRNGKRAFRGLHRTLVILMLMLLPACACCNRPSLGPPVAFAPAPMPWRSVVRWPVSDGQDAVMYDDAPELPWEFLTWLSSALCVMLDWVGLLSKLACWIRKRACPSRVVLRCRRVDGRSEGLASCRCCRLSSFL